jgi:hypothetical protein
MAPSNSPISAAPVDVFIAYSRKDDDLRSKLTLLIKSILLMMVSIGLAGKLTQLTKLRAISISARAIILNKHLVWESALSIFLRLLMKHLDALPKILINN